MSEQMEITESEFRNDLDEMGRYAYDLGIYAGLECAHYLLFEAASKYPECAKVLLGLAQAFREQADEVKPEEMVKQQGRNHD